eukprot:CAMPEP_0170526540 /NCGR_PEP_ID=MMETSP0209-20121228/11935_1 /TAXON_ID=665100 ORGANISM="Litonotus pictus, Strain P1" /NCGR_SAMPLE_ID=MMETSP0209 /ASSEMBLY_ACC=CAM_ASM_000301 /LENGTH=55 /DNA_ID=CAMNT_0010816401 /DNA_START=632 /DNA_END=795 /DNA_ORIENTATION=+
MSGFRTGKKLNPQKDYHESDIFHFNDKISSDKTAEKYTVERFKCQTKPYSVSSKS